MKCCLPLFFVAFAVTLLCSTVMAEDLCRPEDCFTPNKCDVPINAAKCKAKNTVCCSVVKTKYRTHCHHFGGVCMDTCGQSLQHKSVDCPAGLVCCTLVI